MHLNFIQSWVQLWAVLKCALFLRGQHKVVLKDCFPESLCFLPLYIFDYCRHVLSTNPAILSRKWLQYPLFCRLELQDHIQHIIWTLQYRLTETPASMTSWHPYFLSAFYFHSQYHVEVHQKDLCILGCVYRVLFTHSKVPAGCRVTFDVLHPNPSLKLVAKFLHQCLSEKFNFNESLLDGCKIKVECTLFCRYSEAATRTGPNWKERLLYTM